MSWLHLRCHSLSRLAPVHIQTHQTLQCGEFDTWSLKVVRAIEHPLCGPFTSTVFSWRADLRNCLITGAGREILHIVFWLEVNREQQISVVYSHSVRVDISDLVNINVRIHSHNLKWRRFVSHLLFISFTSVRNQHSVSSGKWWAFHFPVVEPGMLSMFFLTVSVLSAPLHTGVPMGGFGVYGDVSTADRDNSSLINLLSKFAPWSEWILFGKP